MRAFLAVVLCMLWGQAHATPPSIDSAGPTAVHIANTSGQSTISVGLTTNQSPDLAVLDFYAPVAGSTPPQIMTVTGCNPSGSGCSGPLTWTRRYRFTSSQPTCGNLINIPCVDDFERWTAVANSPVSATQTVALNLSVVSAQADTYGVFALANVNAPYDPAFTSGPLHAQNTNSAFGTYTNIAVNVTTINRDDLVIGAAASPWWISGDGFIRCDLGGGGANLFTYLLHDDHTQTLVNPQYARLMLEYYQFALPIGGVEIGASNQANPVMACFGPYAPWTFALDVMTGTGSTPPPPGGAFPHVWIHE